tara:strand:- start:1519 stop:1671 length:153 start_codon:yes stop_codon:yes gene_type:complete
MTDKKRLEDEKYFTPEMIKEIKESMLQIERGESETVSTPEELGDLLKNID